MPVTSSNPELSQADIDRRRGRIVPWVIAAFYVTFMAAFIGFVVIAFRNPPNEVTGEAYAKGLAYNETLTQAAEQDDLGWQSGTVYENGRVVFSLRDANHQPIAGAHVRAWLVHPAIKANDRSVELKAVSPGIYAADVVLPSKGRWTVRVTAGQGDREYQSAADIITN
jgi:nitrogen fixation protein FixH